MSSESFPHVGSGPGPARESVAAGITSRPRPALARRLPPGGLPRPDLPARRLPAQGHRLLVAPPDRRPDPPDGRGPARSTPTPSAPRGTAGSTCTGSSRSPSAWVYERSGSGAEPGEVRGDEPGGRLLLVTARRRDWPVWAMLLAWLPALLVLGGRMYIRPETLTLLYLSSTWRSCSGSTSVPALAFLLPVVQVAWVNTQGLFVLGPVLHRVRPDRRGARGRGVRGASGGVVAEVVLVAVGADRPGLPGQPVRPAGALYPLQLAGTMGNPVFSKTIAELKPIPSSSDDGRARRACRSSSTCRRWSSGRSASSCPIALASIRRPRVDPGPAPRGAACPESDARGRRGRESEGQGGARTDATAWRLSPFRLLLFLRVHAAELAGDAEQPPVRGGRRHGHGLELRRVGRRGRAAAGRARRATTRPARPSAGSSRSAAIAGRLRCGRDAARSMRWPARGGRSAWARSRSGSRTRRSSSPARPEMPAPLPRLPQRPRRAL